MTAVGDLLLISTSNGSDPHKKNVAAPEAPSFIALDKRTGKLVWADSSPGMNILHGQWSIPAYAVLGGVPQVMFAGGDGWLYSFLGGGDARRQSPNCSGSSTPTRSAVWKNRASAVANRMMPRRWSTKAGCTWRPAKTPSRRRPGRPVVHRPHEARRRQPGDGLRQGPGKPISAANGSRRVAIPRGRRNASAEPQLGRRLALRRLRPQRRRQD